MIIIDKKKNCLIWKDEQIFFIKPNILKNKKIRKTQIVNHDDIQSYMLYKINKEVANNLLNHYLTYNKLALSGKILLSPIEEFKKRQHNLILNKHNLIFADYYFTERNASLW